MVRRTQRFRLFEFHLDHRTCPKMDSEEIMDATNIEMPASLSLLGWAASSDFPAALFHIHKPSGGPLLGANTTGVQNSASNFVFFEGGFLFKKRSAHDRWCATEPGSLSAYNDFLASFINRYTQWEKEWDEVRAKRLFLSFSSRKIAGISSHFPTKFSHEAETTWKIRARPPTVWLFFLFYLFIFILYLFLVRLAWHWWCNRVIFQQGVIEMEHTYEKTRHYHRCGR